MIVPLLVVAAFVLVAAGVRFWIVGRQLPRRVTIPSLALVWFLVLRFEWEMGRVTSTEIESLWWLHLAMILCYFVLRSDRGAEEKHEGGPERVGAPSVSEFD